jgi:hypothetical protein
MALKFDNSRLVSWHTLALFVLLCYPIMGSKWFPFGGGPRYLSVLVAPICIALLWRMSRTASLLPLLSEMKDWCMPFLPFVVGWIFAQVWHGYRPLDTTPLTHLLWCTLLFAGARILGVNYRQLFVVACLFAAAYGAMAIFEVFVEGRGRAWGGVYENRFGQYAVWMSALCVLHAMGAAKGSDAPMPLGIWAAAAALGLIGVLLSGSRGALFAYFVLIAIALQSVRRIAWQGVVPAVLLLAVLVVVASYLNTAIYSRFQYIYSDVWAYFHETVFTPTSLGIRLELARISILTLSENPVLGAGYTSLKQLYETHPNFGIPNPEILAIPGFHGDWFQAIGIGGGMLLFSLIATYTWLGLRAKDSPYLQSFIGFSLVFGLGELFMTHSLGLGLMMAAWALYSAANKNTRPPL